jgi:hypothetical protein
LLQSNSYIIQLINIPPMSRNFFRSAVSYRTKQQICDPSISVKGNDDIIENHRGTVENVG